MDNGGDLDLIDVWRIKNPELKKDDLYGDKRTPKYIADSIFFFLSKVNAHLAAQSIHPGYKKEKKRKDWNLRA